MIDIFDSGHKWKELQAMYKWDPFVTVQEPWETDQLS